MPADVARIKELFLALLEKAGPDRTAFLDTVCGGDAELRGRLEAMLRTHEASGELLARTPEDLLADADATCASGESAERSTEEDLSFLELPTTPGDLGRLGHYEVREVIGRGGFGIVLKALDQRLQRIVAIKALSPAYAAVGSARKRFIREARAAAAVKNEHVVGIYDVQENAEPPYLVMECIDGISLQDKLDKLGSLGLKEILRIGMQIAEGLEAAHKQGLVHRDIKPANILLENGVERVKITDFGLARAVDDASVTQSGTVAGTPMYMSPEQAEGLPIDHRSDLFSLGTVLYAMCTGQPPFRATGTHAVLKRVIEAAPRPIREINDEVPEWLTAIIGKLHAKNPEDRYPTAREVAELLGQHLAHVQQPQKRDQPAPASPTPTTRGADEPRSGGARPASRKPQGLWFNVVVLGFVAGFSLTWFTWYGFALCIFSLVAIALFFAFPSSAEESSAAAIEEHPAATTLSNRRRWAMLGAVAFLMLAIAVLWLGTPAYRWGADIAEVRFIDQPGMNSVIVLQNEVVVHDWMGVQENPTLTLSPGRYEINGGTITGYRQTGWEVTHAGLFGKNSLRMPGSSCVVTVARGDFVTIRPEVVRQEKDPEVAAAEPGWVQLFNGKDTTGWKTLFDPKIWRVRDGVLIGGGAKGYLVSERKYDNFHFRVQAKFVGKIDSGQWFRFEQNHNTAFEAQIGGDTGSLLRIDPGQPALLFRNKDNSVPPDTWFTQEVIAEGNRIVVKLNGDVVVDTRDDKYRSGHLALQCYNAEGTVYFRQIEIKELPPEEPGWVALFNGKDLSGWQQQKTFVGDWHVEDGQLVCSKTDNAWLFSDRVSANFELRAEFEVERGIAGLILRASRGDGVVQAVYGVGPPGYCIPLNEPRNQWHSVVASCIGNRRSITIDDKRIEDTEDRDNQYRAGQIALQVIGPDPLVRFKKIEIKELPAPEEPGWVQLFNGKDLSGWQEFGAPKTSDGDILLSAENCAVDTVYKLPSLFDLRMKVKLVTGQGTIRFHGQPRKHQFPQPDPKDGYFLIFSEKAAGNIKGELHSKTPFGEVPNSSMYLDKVARCGEWFDLEIVADGKYATVLINGQRRMNVPMTQSAGVLSLWNSDRRKSRIAFRKIEIKDLTPTFKGDKERLQGQWVAVDLEEGGRNQKEGLNVVQWLFTFTGERCRFKAATRAGGAILDQDGLFLTDLGANPKRFRFVAPSDDKQVRQLIGIYEFQGEYLRLCYAGHPGVPTNPDYPAAFATSAQGARC